MVVNQTIATKMWGLITLFLLLSNEGMATEATEGKSDSIYDDTGHLEESGIAANHPKDESKNFGGLSAIPEYSHRGYSLSGRDDEQPEEDESFATQWVGSVGVSKETSAYRELVNFLNAVGAYSDESLVEIANSFPELVEWAA